jgi:pyocin large subunit-like protein
MNRRMLIFAFIALALVALIILAACRQAQRIESTPTTAASPLPTQNETAHAVRQDIGFASRQKWLGHYQKHGHEFGKLTADEYLRQAQMLRDRAVGGDVLESVRHDGVVTRFDQQAGAFLAFNKDLTIRTFFKPNDGANYFWRQSKR